jgi:hypothetical protein
MTIEERGGKPTKQSEFITQVERLVTPGYVECFTDETRKVRNLLLVTSFVLILALLGIISIGQDSVKPPPLPINITVLFGLRWILVALCAYFLVLLGARSYTEWEFWRLRQQASLMQILELNADLRSELVSSGERVDAAFEESVQLFDKLQEKDPELERLSAQLNAAYEKIGSSPALSHFEEFMEIEKRIRHRRQELEPVEERLIQQFRDKSDEHLRLAKDPERAIVLARISYLAGLIPGFNWSLNIRFWFEMMFPILFGTGAILFAIIRR